MKANQNKLTVAKIQLIVLGGLALTLIGCGSAFQAIDQSFSSTKEAGITAYKVLASVGSLEIHDAEYKQEKNILAIKGKSNAGDLITIKDELGGFMASESSKDGEWKISIGNISAAPCNIIVSSNSGSATVAVKFEEGECVSSTADMTVVADPVVTEPIASEPVVADPVVADPVATEPIASEPVAIPEDCLRFVNSGSSLSYCQFDYGQFDLVSIENAAGLKKTITGMNNVVLYFRIGNSLKMHGFDGCSTIDHIESSWGLQSDSNNINFRSTSYFGTSKCSSTFALGNKYNVEFIGDFAIFTSANTGDKYTFSVKYTLINPVFN